MSDTSSSNEPAFPTRGALLGIDYGTKRIGVALATEDQSIASPIENYTRCGLEADARFLKSLADEYGVVGIVVGLPVLMSGDEGGKAREARAFGAWVAEVTGRPVCFWDERYTSQIAETALEGADLTKKRRKRRLDKVAAQVMLQSFLDAPDRSQAPGAMSD